MVMKQPVSFFASPIIVRARLNNFMLEKPIILYSPQNICCTMTRYKSNILDWLLFSPSAINTTHNHQRQPSKEVNKSIFCNNIADGIFTPIGYIQSQLFIYIISRDFLGTIVGTEDKIFNESLQAVGIDFVYVQTPFFHYVYYYFLYLVKL